MQILVVAALAAAFLAPAAWAQATAASRWNTLLINSIRKDFARPPIHARNLFHVSAGMWDAWRAFGGGLPCVR